MKQVTFLLLVFASVLLVSCGNKEEQKPATSDQDMIDAAKALDDKFIAAINNEDLDGVMSCYWNNSDLVVMPPDEQQINGWEDTKKGFAAFFEQTQGVKHEISDAKYTVAGDKVIGWGKVTVTMPGADSAAAPTVLNGRFTSIFAMKDSTMVYIHDHASVPLPPQPHGPVAEQKK